MKINNQLRGRRIRKREWAPDEWIKILFAGQEFAVAKGCDGKEFLFPINGKDNDWILVYPNIPLKPLAIDDLIDEEQP